MLRMADRNYNESKTAPEEIGYDAFISHATKDKEKVVKPLANALTRMKYRVWYNDLSCALVTASESPLIRGF